MDFLSADEKLNGLVYWFFFMFPLYVSVNISENSDKIYKYKERFVLRNFHRESSLSGNWFSVVV